MPWITFKHFEFDPTHLVFNYNLSLLRPQTQELVRVDAVVVECQLAAAVPAGAPTHPRTIHVLDGLASLLRAIFT